eukprot:TRINITY_DN388_c0_g1_i1.p1 TRINITY_DN388_c0_g1~~TRINITY_DN388_c0_g1_i1.p1  ORF type:complete len:115 (-),score=20.53 TRINITY_DN388_c0_g1_i1:67-411(-)
MKYSAVLVVLALLVSVVCVYGLGGALNTPLPIINPEIQCLTNDDCAPKPGCHPKLCINEKFTELYKPAEPLVCTMIYDCSAAYDKYACGCQNGVCYNKNAGGHGCPEGDVSNIQ